MKIKSGQTIDIYTQGTEHLSVTWTEATGFVVKSKSDIRLEQYSDDSSDNQKIKFSNMKIRGTNRINVSQQITSSGNAQVTSIGVVDGVVDIGDFFMD